MKQIIILSFTVAFNFFCDVSVKQILYSMMYHSADEHICIAASESPLGVFNQEFYGL
jgi:hypothetical protein